MKVWNKDEGVIDTQPLATHEERSGQPVGTLLLWILKNFSGSQNVNLLRRCGIHSKQLMRVPLK